VLLVAVLVLTLLMVLSMGQQHLEVQVVAVAVLKVQVQVTLLQRLLFKDTVAEVDRAEHHITTQAVVVALAPWAVTLVLTVVVVVQGLTGNH